ncbi:MAG TPA: serine/threonine-protein kinase, partial [Ktedonobacteraceae bacterium]|nr:serine/threonine-protein kinase [Ktedonobacteraceae bacterium]
RGGVADVYRARQSGEGNYEVAVKIFRPGYAQRDSFRDYFMAEAEKVGQFDHPNILPFLEFGEGDGLLYAVTPFVTSGTLDDLLLRVGGKFSAIQALPILQQLCSAVQYAHDRDVIHGNIKPSNIFVATDGRMLLSDFGIARGYDDSQQSLTRVGWGSAEYAAPEQSLGVLRSASDIYTLGVLLFRILTGQPPFTGQTPVEVLLKHVRQQPPSARALDPNISDAVDGVLHMAMQKRSDDRFASAQEFSHALQAAVTVAPIASPVARSISLTTRQLPPVSPSPYGDPQTPLPATIAFTPPPTIPVPPPAELFASTPPVQQQASSPLDSIAEDTDLTEIRRKSFLEENDDEDKSIFWSRDPLEWSPIGNLEDTATPMTASEYLGSKAVAPEDEPEKGIQENGQFQKKGEIPPASGRLQEVTPPISEKEQSKGSFGKKILPILVVILLLIGLLGALLSTFLFPGPSTGSGAARSTATVSTDAATTLASPVNTRQGATPTAPAKATATTVVEQQTPSPTPVPLPTNPPVPAFACAPGSITLDGSPNFEPAIQQSMNDYNSQCSSTASFTDSADGSSLALDSVASGSSDLAYSDLTSTGRASLVDYQVGALIFAVVVNSDAGVTNLTIAQLQGIYAGKITNWSQVGGTDEPIQVFTRASDSAIRAIFEAFVLKGAQTVNGIPAGKGDYSGPVVSGVLATSGAISYIPLSAVSSGGMQVVSINGVQPVPASVANGSYPFWSIEHLYSNQVAKGLALSFISFLSTSAGLADLGNNGVVPFKDMSRVALESHIPGPTV